MISTINKPFFNKDWILKNMIGFSEDDLRMMEEQLRHERIMNQRILKLNKIINELNKK
jgi:hypothetical protein